eukprot:CAMPEP_0177416406 /NCGR_PEP_ID=MMETSP0368-20130122/68086_1 /TAXON_ID=447022 ORGANISM="Scrippsiella hangoei-like, Strain SHHI-4" /NCGR_SAMPLE_ID=MMETSP0368 /ASSEMBLY_ACC=CAM_ASM_000363 /LENGTH=32 /DNA_ID= /DNA_START= /DNA_END= /DNA_ORIENTATION=
MHPTSARIGPHGVGMRVTALVLCVVRPPELAS